jgi:Ricin-type beta-trefoil lectin domain
VTSISRGGLRVQTALISRKAAIVVAAITVTVLGVLLMVSGTARASGFPGTFQWMPEHFSGPCITAHGGVHKGAKLDQYRCIGARNQTWYVELGPYHEAYIIHPSQNLGLCVDIPGNYRKGTQLILWSCNGRDNQVLHISGCSAAGSIARSGRMPAASATSACP